MVNRYKKLSFNFLVMTIGQFSSKILSFLLVPLYTAILTTEEYGTYDLIVTTVTLLTPFFTLTIAEAIMRFCMDEDYERKEVLTIGILIASIGTLLLASCYPIIKHIDAIADYYGWIVLFFASHNFYLILTQYLKGVNKTQLYAVCGIISTAATLILNVVFLIGLSWGIFGYLLAYVIGHVLIILFILFKINIFKCVTNPFKIKATVYKDLLTYSIPMVPNSICWWISNSSDKYMVRAMVSASALGIYSVSYKIPNIMAIFTTIFNSAWQISAVEDFGSEDSKKFYSNIYRLFSAGNVIFASFLILLSKPLALLLYQKDFYVAWKASAILIMAFVFNALAGLVGSVYTSAKKTHMLFYSTIVAAVSNILFNLLLIPVWGTLGAAAATFISYFLVWGIRIVHSRKILKFKINLFQNLVSYCLLIVQVIIIVLEIRYCYIYAGIVFSTILLINMKSLIQSEQFKGIIKKVSRKKMGE